MVCRFESRPARRWYHLRVNARLLPLICTFWLASSALAPTTAHCETPAKSTKSPVSSAYDAVWGLVHEGIKGEIGVLLGATSFGENAGLGNAHFDDDVPDGGLAYGLRGGVLIGPSKRPRFGLDLEFRFAHPELNHPPVSAATAWAWRIIGRYMFAPKWRLQPFASVGFGQEIQFAAKEYVDLTDFDAALVLGGGVDIKILHRLHGRVDLRWVLSEPRPDSGADGVTFGVSNTLEVLFGVAYLIGGPPPDEDDDHVYDDGRDKCPDRPEDIDGFQDEDGCPDDDNDQDGIVDALDKCPDSAEDMDNYKDHDGCPEPDNDDDGVLDLMDKCPNDPEDMDGHQDADGCPELDNDGDGVDDKKDQCPNAKEDKDGHEDADGCPDLDNDGDGVVDSQDKCPNSAEDYDGFKDADGCPDVDNDGDGIPDTKDRCPLQPETFNGFEDTDGCPDSNSPEVQALFTGPIAGVVYVADKLEPVASERAMQRILAVLKAEKSLRLELRCPVGGVTGIALIGQKTGARCGSVRDWLVQQGVAKARLKPVAETKARGPAKVSTLELARW